MSFGVFSKLVEFLVYLENFKVFLKTLKMPPRNIKKIQKNEQIIKINKNLNLKLLFLVDYDNFKVFF